MFDICVIYNYLCTNIEQHTFFFLKNTIFSFFSHMGYISMQTVEHFTEEQSISLKISNLPKKGELMSEA